MKKKNQIRNKAWDH